MGSMEGTLKVSRCLLSNLPPFPQGTVQPKTVFALAELDTETLLQNKSASRASEGLLHSRRDGDGDASATTEAVAGLRLNIGHPCTLIRTSKRCCQQRCRRKGSGNGRATAAPPWRTVWKNLG